MTNQAREGADPSSPLMLLLCSTDSEQRAQGRELLVSLDGDGPLWERVWLPVVAAWMVLDGWGAGVTEGRWHQLWGRQVVLFDWQQWARDAVSYWDNNDRDVPDPSRPFVLTVDALESRGIRLDTHEIGASVSLVSISISGCSVVVVACESQVGSIVHAPDPTTDASIQRAPLQQTAR
jgi:hypothetical protein